MFDLNASMVLNDADRELIRGKLGPRINKAGVLQVRSERHRSQRMNRDDAVEKFTVLLADALEPPVPRRKTKVSRASKARRVDQKKRRSDVKRGRKEPIGEDS